MSPLRLNGSTSGYSQLDAPAVAGDQTFTLPGTGGTLATTNGGQTVQFAAGSAGSPAITTTGDTNTGVLFPAADTIAISTNGNERARCDSSGRLLVGTSSWSDASRLVVQGRSDNAAAQGVIHLARGQAGSAIGSGSGLGEIFFGGNDSSLFGAIRGLADGATGSNDYPGRIELCTTPDGSATPVERMRISQNGAVDISHNNNVNVLYTQSTATSGFTSPIITCNFSQYAPNNTTARFMYMGDNTALRAEFRSNGGLANYQANNVNLSDINTKKDITPAANTWDCIKEWEIVNYRYKDQPDDADLNLGVIAQQVAESCPEVITVFQEAKEATEDQPAQEERLGIKEQQMYWMAIKALQEAMSRIETLEASNADLAARLTALEAA